MKQQKPKGPPKIVETEKAKIDSKQQRVTQPPAPVSNGQPRKQPSGTAARGASHPTPHRQTPKRLLDLVRRKHRVDADVRSDPAQRRRVLGTQQLPVPELAPILLAWELPSGRYATEHICVSSGETFRGLQLLAATLCAETGTHADSPECTALAQDAYNQLSTFLTPYGATVPVDTDSDAAPLPREQHTPICGSSDVIVIRISVHRDGVLYTDQFGWRLGCLHPSPEVVAKSIIEDRGWPENTGREVAWHIRRQSWLATWQRQNTGDQALINCQGLDSGVALAKLNERRNGSIDEGMYSVDASYHNDTTGEMESIQVINFYKSSPVIREPAEWRYSAPVHEPMGLVDLHRSTIGALRHLGIPEACIPPPLDPSFQPPCTPVPITLDPFLHVSKPSPPPVSVALPSVPITKGTQQRRTTASVTGNQISKGHNQGRSGRNLASPAAAPKRVATSIPPVPVNEPIHPHNSTKAAPGTWTTSDSEYAAMQQAIKASKDAVVLSGASSNPKPAKSCTVKRGAGTVDSTRLPGWKRSSAEFAMREVIGSAQESRGPPGTACNKEAGESEQMSIGRLVDEALQAAQKGNEADALAVTMHSHRVNALSMMPGPHLSNLISQSVTNEPRAPAEQLPRTVQLSHPVLGTSTPLEAESRSAQEGLSHAQKE